MASKSQYKIKIHKICLRCMSRNVTKYTFNIVQNSIYQTKNLAKTLADTADHLFDDYLTYNSVVFVSDSFPCLSLLVCCV